MTWFYVDDHLHDHKKARRAGLEAMGLWTLAGSWCADNLTDGFVPADVAWRWTGGMEAADRIGKELVAAGLWEDGEEDGERGWYFHDWEDVQKTREQILSQREKRVAAGREGGIRSGASRRSTAKSKPEASPGLEPPEGDCSADASSNAEAPAQAEPEASAEANASALLEAESNPVPSRPVPYSAPTERAPATPSPDALDGMPEPVETEGQLVNRLTKTYTDRVKLSKFPAAMAIVRKAVRDLDASGQRKYDDRRIVEALGRLADENRTLTEGKLHTELDGFDPSVRASPSNQRRTSEGFHAGVDAALLLREQEIRDEANQSHRFELEDRA